MQLQEGFAMLYDSDESDDPLSFLHQNIVSNSEKQSSSQGSVFYVKLISLPNQDPPLQEKEFVAKVYSRDNQYSYETEVGVLE